MYDAPIAGASSSTSIEALLGWRTLSQSLFMQFHGALYTARRHATVPRDLPLRMAYAEYDCDSRGASVRA